MIPDDLASRRRHRERGEEIRLIVSDGRASNRTGMSPLLRLIVIFSSTYLIGVNIWSVFEVIIRGEYEPKLGGPLSNVLFGAGFSVILGGVVSGGFVLFVLVSQGYFAQRISPVGSAIAAALAVTVTISGAIASFLAIIGGELGSVVLFYILLGLFCGFLPLLLGLVEKPNPTL